MRRFKFTQDGGVLTEAQRQFYEDNGYIIIRNNVSHELLDKIRERFVDICDGKIDKGSMIVIRDPSLTHKNVKGEFLINKIQDILFDDIFFKYAAHKPLIDVTENIIGPNITAVNSILINKPPNADPDASLHPLHQDMHYFPFRPAERIVASWTAMERVDKNNGCLYVIPGTHQRQLYPHSYPEGFKKKLYHGVEGLDNLPIKVYVIMDKGDTIFFHPLLLHGSGPNLSKGFRKAISVHFADSNCYFVNLKEISQVNMIAEMEASYAKKGIPLKIVDIWKFKSRLIKGNPGTFQSFNSHI